jgi:ATP-dependent Clp protease ATP-binding subunit ClpC
MFEPFTEKAIKVIMLAQKEALRLGHNYVGDEHLLLGLIPEGPGIAAKFLQLLGLISEDPGVAVKVLKSMDVNLQDVRIEVKKIIGQGPGFVASKSMTVEIPFTPQAKQVLEFSLAEARQLNHNYIGAEHLLLGLIREGEGMAARVLESLGVDLTKVRMQVIQMLE